MRLAVIGETAPEALVGMLGREGYAVLRLPRAPHLPAPVAAHPDLSVFFAPDAVCATAEYAHCAQKELACICRAVDRPLRIVTGKVGSLYPQDVLLDALPIGGLLFCLPCATAPELTAHPAYRTVAVKQGYAKCATLPIGNTALASADPSILRAAEKQGLEAVRLTAGGIVLDGYDTGFIGGAASFAPYGGCDTVFFCGDLGRYPDGAKLTAAITAHGLRICDVKGAPLTDIGTIFLFGGTKHGTT